MATLIMIMYNLDINVFLSLNCLIFICGFSAKMTCRNKHVRVRKTTVSHTFNIRLRFKGYRVDRTLSFLNVGSLEITLTVPLSLYDLVLTSAYSV